MLAINLHISHTTAIVCTGTSTDRLTMRAHLARRKETLVTMAFIIQSYAHPDDEVFQLYAEISIEELVEDLLAELSIILSAQAAECTLTADGVALSPCVTTGYDMQAERKEWFGLQNLF